MEIATAGMDRKFTTKNRNNKQYHPTAQFKLRLGKERSEDVALI